MEVNSSRKMNTSPEIYFPQTSARAGKSVTRSRSNVWRSRSTEIAPLVSAGATKLIITSSIQTIKPKAAFPKLRRSSRLPIVVSDERMNR